MPRRRRVRLTAEGAPISRQIQREDSNQNEQQEHPQPAMFQKGTKLDSELIMQLQRKYGNRVVHQMLMEQDTENDSSGAPIQDAVLTLQTTPPQMGLDMLEMMEILVRLTRRLRLEKHQVRIADQDIQLSLFSEILRSYQEAFDMKMLGSLVNGEQGKAIENYGNVDPFADLNEDIARVAMSPGHMLAAMQHLTLEIGKILTGDSGKDGKMAVDRMINAPLRQLIDHLEVIETVDEGEQAAQRLVVALEAIYAAAVHLKV